jgi:hypothetical protein
VARPIDGNELVLPSEFIGQSREVPRPVADRVQADDGKPEARTRDGEPCAGSFDHEPLGRNDRRNSVVHHLAFAIK